MSGGGSIVITRSKVEVSLQTERKTPMMGDEQRYANSVNDWEKKTAAKVEALSVQIEKLMSPFESQMGFLSDQFKTNQTMREYSSEGTLERSSSTDGPNFRLVLHLARGHHIYGGNLAVSFVTKAIPMKDVVRKFAFAVDALARKEAGLEPEIETPSYGVYWLEFEGTPNKKSILLSKVELSQLTKAIQDSPYGSFGFETFRSAQSLVVDLDEKGKMAKNPWGYYMANPTAAKFGPDLQDVVLQIGGSMKPKARIHRAPREEVFKIIGEPLGEAGKNDHEFFESIKDRLG